MDVIRSGIEKGNQNPLMTDSSGPRSGQSGHCAGELGEEIRNNPGRGRHFSLARLGIISAG